MKIGFKYFALLSALASLWICAGADAAEVRAWLDRNSMQMGETVTLNVEVTGDNDRLLGLDDQVVQGPKLVLAVPELQRQVHEKHAHILKFQLNDEALDPGVEVVETLAAHMWSGQKSIRLLAHDRHELIERTAAILALVGRVVADLRGNVFRLVDHAGAY